MYVQWVYCKFKKFKFTIKFFIYRKIYPLSCCAPCCTSNNFSMCTYNGLIVNLKHLNLRYIFSFTEKFTPSAAAHRAAQVQSDVPKPLAVFLCFYRFYRVSMCTYNGFIVSSASSIVTSSIIVSSVSLSFCAPCCTSTE